MDMSQCHRLSNHFSASRLVSLAKLKMASEIFDRDKNGPYVVAQTGYDPEDVTMQVQEYILSRSGEWLDMRWFVRMPVKERREAFIFSTVVEVMTLMGELVGPVRILRGSAISQEAEPDTELERTITGQA